MLEFIVLGQIPGTTFQITFLQVASFAAAFIIGLVAAHELDKLAMHADKAAARANLEAKTI